MSGDAWAAGIQTFLAAWLLNLLLHSTILLGAAWLLSRRVPISLREMLWKGALLGALITASWQTAGIGLEPLGGRVILPVAAEPAPLAVLLTPMTGETDAIATSSPWWNAIHPTSWLVGLWLLGAGIGFLRLALTRRRLWGILGRRQPVPEGTLAETLERLRRASGFRPAIRLTTSQGISGPMALERNEICLPERALTALRLEEQESALAHELAHLARRDPAWNGVGAFLGCLLFFQPLVRVARRELRESAEFLSDDWAVRHTGRGIALARCLVEVAEWQRGAWPGARLAAAYGPAMADHPSSLVRRIERLVGGPRREPPRILSVAGALVLVLSVTALAPGVTPRREMPTLYPFPDLAFVPVTPVLPSAPRLRERRAVRTELPKRESRAPRAVRRPVRAAKANPSVPPTPATGEPTPADPREAPSVPDQPAPVSGAEVRGTPVAVLVILPPSPERWVRHRILLDDQVAPTDRAIMAARVRFLQDRLEAQQATHERLVVSRQALRRALQAERLRMAEVYRGLLESMGDSTDVQALQRLLEAYEQNLRVRLEPAPVPTPADRI